MNKSIVRKHILHHRKLLSLEEVNRRSLSISAKCQALMDEWDVKVAHIFLPIHKNREVNTWHIVALLKDYQVKIGISKTDFVLGSMKHFVFSEDLEITDNIYGIPEPPDHGQPLPSGEIELVFVPLLAMDRKGGRLGYGKGFYDKFLSDASPDTIKVGLNLTSCLDELPFLEPHDIKMNYGITPFEIIKF